MILGVTVVVIGIIGCFIWQKRQVGNSPNTASGQEQQESSSTVSVALINKITGEPIRNTKVVIYSDNGTRCITTPCPTNGKSWDGTTNAQGLLAVPQGSIQQSTSFTATGYESTSLGYMEYDEAKTEYTLGLSPL